MNKKILLILVGLGILIVGAGGWFGYQALTRPNRAFAEAREISKDINSAEFTFEQKMVINYEFENNTLELDEISFVSSGDGAFDLDKGDMRLKMLIDAGDLGNQEVTIYKIGDDAYATIQGRTNKITQEDLDKFISSESEGIDEGKILQKLEDGIEYELVGTETINGSETFKYEVTMEEGLLKEIFDSVKEGINKESFEQSGFDISDIEFEAGEAGYTVWVDQETFEPVREVVTIDRLVYNFPDLFKATVTDVTMLIEYQSINKEVNIKAPLSI